ncbi:MAG TPA: hypothetical protein VF719_02315 [Abditibacteriaceae bacterium]|jgi:hypothetical protein
MPTASLSVPSAEILESSTAAWVAQCRDLHCAPDFGSFVRAPDADESGRVVVYGVVAHIETEPFDASRRPLALWTREDEMDARHPQIGKLLRTVYRARCIGWAEGTNLIQSLPPQPPRLHSFVLPCSPDEVRRFTDRTDFVRILLDGGSGETGADELLVAVCREAVRAHGGDMNYKIKIGSALAILLRADYHRLRALLSRIGI